MKPARKGGVKELRRTVRELRKALRPFAMLPVRDSEGSIALDIRVLYASGAGHGMLAHGFPGSRVILQARRAYERSEVRAHARS